VSFPNDPEGAPGPLRLGTGNGREAGGLELVELSPQANARARSCADRIGGASESKRSVTARVDTLPDVSLFLPGPQMQGTGATLNGIKSRLKPVPPAKAMILRRTRS